MQATGWLTDPRYDAGLDELARLDRVEAQAFAARVRVLAELAARTSREGWQGEAPFASLVLDVAGTCLLGQVAAGSRLLDAEHLVARLPGVLRALEEGSLRVPQAQVLVEQTRDLAPAACCEVERRVLPQAGRLCPADLRRLLKRTVLEVDAEAVARREVEARRARRTWVRPAEDGTALLCALLPAEQARAVLAGLTEQARQARCDGDDRTVDQLRADLLVDACLGLRPCSDVDLPAASLRRRPVRPVRVVVHVPLAVALGLSDAAAELEGHGPISASHARRLLLDAEVQRACVDPETGRVWALDEDVVSPRTPDGRRGRAPAPARAEPAAPQQDVRQDPRQSERRPPDRQQPDLRRQLERRRQVDAVLGLLSERPPPVPLPPEPGHDPSAGLSRLVHTRDTRCDGPGCSVPAARCELDHEVPWPTGETRAENLVSRSQRCHHAKHQGWSALRTPAGTTWTSPGGRRYLVPRRGPLPLPARGASRRARRAVALRERGYLLVPLPDLDLPDLDLAAVDLDRPAPALPAVDPPDRVPLPRVQVPSSEVPTDDTPPF